MSHTDHTNRSACGQAPAGQDVSPELQRQIDENLRRLYCQPVDDGLPDRLQTLIEQLRQRARGR